MTLKEFYVALKKAPNKWRINKNGAIRNNSGDCPITAVARGKDLTIKDVDMHLYSYSPHDYEECADHIGLRSENIIEDIINAADKTTSELSNKNEETRIKARVEVRKQMLKILKLKEKGAN